MDFSNYDTLNDKTTDYMIKVPKDIINGYIDFIQEVRDVNFLDISVLSEMICMNMVSNVIEACDMTVDDIKRRFAEIANNINISCSDNGLLIKCTIEYIPNGEYVISVPYKMQMQIAVQKNKVTSCTFGLSAFEITENNQKCLYDSNTLFFKSFEDPESFNFKLFCNL